MLKLKRCEVCPTEFNPNKKSVMCCSKECSIKLTKNQILVRFLNNEYSSLDGKRLEIPDIAREFIFKKTNYKCSDCGDLQYNIHNGLHVNQIDHIDGNPSNNHPDNLRTLCPNCHSMTKTWAMPKKRLG